MPLALPAPWRALMHLHLDARAAASTSPPVAAAYRESVIIHGVNVPAAARAVVAVSGGSDAY